MCVIAIKRKKTHINYDTVVDMFDTNPDGAGFAIVEHNKITISKGYNKIAPFWDAIKNYQDEYLVLHFRIATHGLITPAMCHPFIITKDIADTCITEAETTEPVLFHNGTISGFGNKQISDTAEYANTVLPYIPDIKTKLRLLDHTDAKFVLIENNQVHRVGQFYKYKGLTVSNTYFIKKTYEPTYIRPNSCIGHSSYANTCYVGKDYYIDHKSKYIPMLDEVTGTYYDYDESTGEYYPILD